MRLTLDRRVKLYDRGRVLVADGRIIRLSDAGPAALRALLADTASPAQRRLGDRLVRAGFAHPRPAPRALDVTTVIPTRDRDVHAPGALVVDDGSRVPIAGASVRREMSGGPAAARNVGLEHVTTKFVAFLDSDCVAPPDWIERLGGHFDDPSVAAVAPRIKALDGRRSLLDMGPEPAEVGRRLTYVPAAALIVRRAAEPRFDPALRYGEDVDLVWRLLDAGWRVRYDPSVVVLHDDRDRLRRRFLYGTSAAPLAARHPGRLAHVKLRPWPAATLALLLARRPWLAALTYGVQTARVAWLLRSKRVPVRVAPTWTARALVATAAQFPKLVTPYGAGLLFGKLRSRMRGLPTISGPSIL